MTNKTEEPITFVIVYQEVEQADISNLKFEKPEVIETKVRRINVAKEEVKSRPVRIVHQYQTDDQ